MIIELFHFNIIKVVYLVVLFERKLRNLESFYAATSCSQEKARYIIKIYNI